MKAPWQSAGLIFLLVAQFLQTTTVGQTRQARITFQLDTRFEVGGISKFDRRKFITMHSSTIEPDWQGEEEKLRYLTDELDVYFGRDTGRITWALTQMKEDPGHKGFVDFGFMDYYGRQARGDYADKKSMHRFADHDDLVVCAQLRPFWPDGTKITPPDGSSPWSVANAAASGQFMAYWVNLFTGGNGPPRPRLLEITNEPLYELSKQGGQVPPKDVFEFHRDAAIEIRRYCPEIQIGGYTAAFPDPNRNDFRQWHDRWKSFIDITGEKVDFYSLHLYDFPGIEGGKKLYRKGCHLEATLDMIEHYSVLSFGTPKPFVVSEYGSQLHDWYDQPWSPYRDWLCLKACNSILLQLMSRPDRIQKAIPFITAKAEWGFNENGSGQPYYWRLLRRENEPESFTGKYVFTEQIRFYELWSDVRGTRVVSSSSDPNLLCDAYVDGNDVFLIINNLTTEPVKPDIHQYGITDNAVSQAFGKHLYIFDDKPRLDTVDLRANDSPLVLGSESTMILRLNYVSPVELRKTVRQHTYYATAQLERIQAGKPLDYQIAVVDPASKGQAVLRVGIGRPHNHSLRPTVIFNNNALSVPRRYRGPEQADRESFFGILEIPVPPEFLREENRIAITFDDTGGHVSSVLMHHVH